MIEIDGKKICSEKAVFNNSCQTNQYLVHMACEVAVFLEGLAFCIGISPCAEATVFSLTCYLSFYE
jgi:hypothetical protein